jgi:hypothetical protein
MLLLVRGIEMARARNSATSGSDESNVGLCAALNPHAETFATQHSVMAAVGASYEP